MKNFKTLIATVALFLTTTAYSQNWNHIGTSGSIQTATEMDFVIAANGDMHVFYVNNGSSNNGIKTWNGSTWTAVGPLNWLPTSATDLRIEALSDGTPVISYRFISGAQDYIRVLLWTGTVWDQYGASSFATDDYYPYDMNVSENDGIYLAYYKDQNGYPGVLNEMNYCSLTSTTGTALGNPMSEFMLNSISVATDGNENHWEIHGDYDIGIYTPLNRYIAPNFTAPSGGGTMSTSGILASQAEIRYVNSSEKFISLYKRDNNPSYTTNVRYYNLATNTYSTQATIGNGILNSDLAVASDGFAYVLNETSAYGITRVNLSTMATQVYASSFTNTNTIDNPRIDTENGILVVAWINQSTNQIEVYEEDNTATISLNTDITTCSGINYSTSGANFTISDNNYDHSYLSFSIQSDNNAVINSTSINVTGTYPNYSLQFPSAALLTNTQVEFTIEVYEDGNYVTEDYLFVNLQAVPTITSSLPAATCINSGFINLMPFVTPQGGTWSGTAVTSNKFYPSSSGAGTFNLIYTKIGSNGCKNKDTSSIVVNPIPNLVVTTTPASCGNQDGTAVVNINSGAPLSNFTVYWSNGESNVANIDDLAMGSYFVNVTNSNGCTAVASASISSTAFSLSSAITQVDCFSDSDGAIDLTVTGSTGPYTYVWSNGESTEDLTNLSPGIYDVTVTDASNCQGVQSYTVNDPGEIYANVVITDANCGLGDGSLESFGTGGTGTLTYQWYEDGGTFIDNAPLITSLEGGTYYVIITDANGCTKLENVTLNENGGPSIDIDSVFNVTCSSLGSIYTTINSSAGIQNVNWSNGATTDDIIGLTTGFYSIEVEDVNSCIGTASVTIVNQGPDEQILCMVTVDSSTNTNRVVWEKPISTDISHYNIYRETSVLGTYQFVDSVLYADESFFNDTIASPMIRSWRYKIAAVDNCGHEGDMSPVHKTIHLTINTGLSGVINLAWDEYEGFNYPTFNIYRFTTPSGWVLIQSLPSNSFSYTDIAPTANGLTYMVVISPPSQCTSTKATDYNSSRSNRTTTAFNPNGVGITEFSTDGIYIYPNPTNEKITISGDNIEGSTFRLLDYQGRVLTEKAAIGTILEFDLNSLADGIYFVQYYHEGKFQVQKIVKQ